MYNDNEYFDGGKCEYDIFGNTNNCKHLKTLIT